jgi:hypothetical protein
LVTESTGSPAACNHSVGVCVRWRPKTQM